MSDRVVSLGGEQVPVEFRDSGIEQRDMRWYVEGTDTEFEGYFDLYEVQLKESNSRRYNFFHDEWRKLCVCRILRDGKCVYDMACDDANYALAEAAHALRHLKAFDNWDKVREGGQVYYREIPAVIKYVTDDGCVILEREDGEPFPPNVWNSDDGIPYSAFDAKSVKVEILSPLIWWWREVSKPVETTKKRDD